MNKTTSPEQLDANRRNAQKSTGPKTPEGRAVSKMNALKHGIFSKEVLVRGLNIKENSRDLEGLYERFWQQYSPVGPVEEMLVDQIITAHWRLRRALRAESGEIALSVDQGKWQRSRPQIQLRRALWESSGDQISSMEESGLGIVLLQGWLRDIRKSVENEGELTEAATRLPCFGKTNSLSLELEELRLKQERNPDGLEPMALRERNKNQVLAFLDKELSLLMMRKTDCETREDAEEEARQAAAVLPAPEVLDKILRYETTLQRQLYRALAQLERLQRMRQGEAVPAPMMMEVSERA
ncbi:MAG TPA: hypothetical protein VFC44_26440 [Candidatus Saccharimonadales bacterium]|nr:hypothetical protein [Candidatus Saccharimonadales bacterium]